MHRFRMLSMATTVALLLSLVLVAGTQASSTTRVANNIAPWLGQSKLVSHANPSGRVYLSVYLNNRNEAGLSRFLQDLYRPGSAVFHRFLTPAQFHAAYSPTAASVLSGFA